MCPLSSSFLLLMPPLPSSTLFPYTTLFRSLPVGGAGTAPVAVHRLNRGFELEAPERADSLRPSQPLIPRRNQRGVDRKSTRLNSSHVAISYAVFCLKKKKRNITRTT